MLCTSLLALAASVATSSATIYSGFNYGATFNDGSAKHESDFHAEFTTAMNLIGTNGEFTSARLYTMIVGFTSEIILDLVALTPVLARRYLRHSHFGYLCSHLD
jgi:glucan endo-1,3-beta-D-glucosidase